ncbi:MAG: hypothetical protein GY816_11190 [Cytophagales bacterium]|nr:hypothetical protein [Cytophagales bacterium]
MENNELINRFSSTSPSEEYYFPSDKVFLFIKPWLLRDKWSFYEAACLFCSFIPLEKITVTNDKRFKKPLKRTDRQQDFLRPNDLLGIFENADWESLTNDDNPTKKPQDAFIRLLKSKQVPIPEEILLHYESSKKNLPEPQITPEMLKVLTPIIEVINSYGNSTLYTKKDKSYQIKKVIMEWIKNDPDNKPKHHNDRFKDVVADLIIGYYDL